MLIFEPFLTGAAHRMIAMNGTITGYKGGHSMPERPLSRYGIRSTTRMIRLFERRHSGGLLSLVARKHSQSPMERSTIRR